MDKNWARSTELGPSCGGTLICQTASGMVRLSNPRRDMSVFMQLHGLDPAVISHIHKFTTKPEPYRSVGN